jgi:hypothetical protein
LCAACALAADLKNVASGANRRADEGATAESEWTHFASLEEGALSIQS